MNSLRHSMLVQLLLFSVVLLWSSSFSNAKEETNNKFCDFGPDALPGFDQTCIPSTAYNGRRCFYTYIPECAKESSSTTTTMSVVPLVFDIHGLGSCPQFNLYYTGWKEKADENCFVLVLPIGNTDPDITASTCFAVPGGLQIGKDTMDECCCSEPGIIETSSFDPSLTDDLRFLRQTAAAVVRDVPVMTSNQTAIDTKRIYFAGHSNGCMISLAMAAVHSDLVAAVGCHAGTMLTPFAQDYIPTPIWMVIGTADPLVSYNGGSNHWWNWMYPSSATMFSLFATANQCNFTATQVIDPAPGSNANTYSMFEGTSCKDDANVVLLALDDVGHNPYLDDNSEDVPNGIGQPVTLDTTQMAWDFVKTHSLKDVPNLDDVPPDEAPTSSSYKMTVCSTFILSIATIIFGFVV